MEELTLEATIENIPVVEDFVHNSLDALPCSMKTVMQLDIAIDELFGNIAHYAYAPNSGKATISATFDTRNRVVSFSFIDSGVPFDPLQKKAPDISQKLEDRKIGGLGIYMVKQSMDNVRYEYRDGLNILTIEKKI